MSRSHHRPDGTTDELALLMDILSYQGSSLVLVRAAEAARQELRRVVKPEALPRFLAIMDQSTGREWTDEEMIGVYQCLTPEGKAFHREILGMAARE